jgi:hypothetical protein
MKHLTSDAGDMPPPLFALDRRCTPDRRTVWRGGRRDSDWRNRPLGGLDRIEDAARRRNSLLRKALSALNVW